MLPPSSVAKLATASTTLVDEIVSRWEAATDKPSAMAICEEYPEIWQDSGLVARLACEEFRIRRQRGEALSVNAFCQQFASYQDNVRRMMSVHLAVEQHPSWLAGLTEELEEPEIRWPEPGETFLRFQVVREIGRGGLARAYLAQEQVVGNRLVVLKVSTRDSGEARIMGRLQHPGIMPILQVDHDPVSDLHVVVMPFLGTTTLYDVLNRAFPNRQGPVPQDVEFIRQLAEEGRAGLDTSVLAGRSLFDVPGGSYLAAMVELGIQLAEALIYTHERGVLHRDLKPSNVLVTPQGLALLMDFNLSARTDGPGLLVGGTIPYMPTELLSALSGSDHVRLTTSLPPFGSTWNTICRDDNATNDLRAASTNDELGGWIACADPRSDLFSWGVILYELLTGRLPFGEPDVRQPVNWQAEWVLKRQLDRPLQRAQVNQHIPDDLFQLVQQCLAIDADARPASAQEVVAELRRIRAAAAETIECRGGGPPGESVESAAPLVATSVATVEFPAAPAAHAATPNQKPNRRSTAVIAVLATMAIGLAVAVPRWLAPNSPIAIGSALPTGSSGEVPGSGASDTPPVDGQQVETIASLLGAAESLIAEAKWNEALLKLQRAYDLGDEPGRNFAQQARCILQEGSFSSGAGLSRNALEAGFVNAAVCNNYGYALLKNRGFKQAQKELKRALLDAPDHPVILHNLAIVEYSLGNHWEAYQLLRRAIERRADHSAELYWDAAWITAEVATPGSDLERESQKYVLAALAAGFDAKQMKSAQGPIRRIVQTVDVDRASAGNQLKPSKPGTRLIDPWRSPGNPNTLATDRVTR